MNYTEEQCYTTQEKTICNKTVLNILYVGTMLYLTFFTITQNKQDTRELIYAGRAVLPMKLTTFKNKPLL